MLWTLLLCALIPRPINEVIVEDYVASIEYHSYIIKHNRGVVSVNEINFWDWYDNVTDRIAPKKELHIVASCHSSMINRTPMYVGKGWYQRCARFLEPVGVLSVL